MSTYLAIDIKGQQDNVPTNAYICWSYPEIYDKSNPSTITLSLEHTRASDGIRIKYDSERDGWQIEQASTFSWAADDKVCDPDWQEVAFIPSWGREKELDIIDKTS